MKSTGFVMNFVMLAIFAAMVGIASQYPPQARFMPFVVGIPAMALCLLQIFLDIRAARRNTVEVEDDRSDVERARDEASRYAGRQVESEATTDEDVPVLDEGGVPKDKVGREIVLWAFFLSFITGILVFGFWISIPIFLVSFLHLEAKLSWVKAVLAGGVGAGILYLAVAKGLRVELFPGFLTAYLLDL